MSICALATFAAMERLRLLRAMFMVENISGAIPTTKRPKMDSAMSSSSKLEPSSR